MHKERFRVHSEALGLHMNWAFWACLVARVLISVVTRYWKLIYCFLT